MGRSVARDMRYVVAAVCEESSVENIKQAFALFLPEYQLKFVASPDTCLAAVRTERPSVLLLDRFLQNTDSLNTLRAVRAFCDIPVLLLSYDRDEGAVVNALESGADGLLTKPLRQMELASYVKSMVKRMDTTG